MAILSILRPTSPLPAALTEACASGQAQDPHERWQVRAGIALPPFQHVQWRLKRLMDIVLSAGGLLLLSPFLLVVALLIVVDSPGPVFIRQTRVGYMGQEFSLIKFRSMVPQADKLMARLKDRNETNALMFKMKNDPRITRVGRWIRKYSIDELPQLWNVLHGEMSLVGPRPPLPREVSHYHDNHWVRLLTVPGITGNWQVNGRSAIQDFNLVCRLDEDYIRNWSLAFDFKILAKTLPAVLNTHGAA